MKTTIQILFLSAVSLLGTESGYAQSGSLEWAKKVDGPSNNNAFGIAVDAGCNIFLAGDFNGTITLGAGDSTETTFDGSHALGDYDVFVAQYTPSGDLLWAKRAAGSSFGGGHDIATDDSGNILMTGQFSRTAAFGAGELNETILNTVGKYDIYIAKLNPSGVLQWVKQAGGPTYDYCRGIAVDGSGNILMTGYFEETITFGAGEVNETILTSPGHTDIFVAKYDPSGVLLWVKKPGGPSKERGHDIAADDSGNILVTGTFKKTATFGAGEIHETIYTSTGRFDIFVAKYTPDGILLWVKKAGGTREDAPTAVATDGSGNILVTGHFEEAITFGAGEPNETVLTSDGEMDFFISKYAPGGELLWVKKIEDGIGWSDGFPSAVATDESCNIFVTGQFRDRIRFGEGEVNDTVLMGDDDLDVFIAEYASSGDLLWAIKAGGPNFDHCEDIAIDGFGNILVAGDFFETLTFGIGEPNETILTSSGFSDIFFAKFSGNLTGVAEPTTATPKPKAFLLEQNYPNPFNPETTIIFKISVEGHAILKIYNMQGQVVRVLFNGHLSAKQHQVVWDGKNDQGNQVPAGIYFYNLHSEGRVEARKMVLIK